MPRRGCSFRDFLSSPRGVAAIEFGYMFPVLLILLLVSIDMGRALAIAMKVRYAAYSVDAMANQYILSIDDTTMQAILGASATVLAPYAPGPVTVKLTQVKIVSGGTATVVWSDGYNTTGYTVGSSVTTLPSNLTSNTAPTTCATFPCYVLMGEVSYTYTPMFGNFITGPITLSDKLYATPRSVICIQRNNIPASC
jgi:Flp pilus assembly protein TadG